MTGNNRAIRITGLECKDAPRQGGTRASRFILAAVMAVDFALVLRAAPASATTYTVNTLDDSNGNSDCSLRDTINAANGTPTSGSTCTRARTGKDTIRFSVTGTIGLTSTLPEITDSQLTIKGPPSPGITIDGGHAVQMMQVASGTTLSLDGLTISNGNGSSTTDPGGAISNHGDVKITNSAFSGSSYVVTTSVSGGGAIFNDGKLAVTNSTFTDNVTGCSTIQCTNQGLSFGGGAIFNNGTLSVTKSTFSSNFVGTPFHFGEGGGIFNENGTLTVTNSHFSNNNTDGVAGAISSENGALTVTNSTFSQNGAQAVGAILNEGTGIVTNSTFTGNETLFGEPAAIENGGTLTISNSTFSGNIGGAIRNVGALTVTNCTFSDNSANTVGGAIDNDGGKLIVTNSTMSGNSGDFGAAISNGAEPISNGGELMITNSTLFGNHAFDTANAGGALDSCVLPACLGILKNTIVASTTIGNGGATDNCVGALTDGGYNISDDNSCGFTAAGSLNNTNPGLSSDGPTNNGGPTQTIALAPGSPAIDAIRVADCTDQNGNRLRTDQRGFPRPDAGESVCDIGAFETQDPCAKQQGNNNCQ
jgi:CSLREA domain-containing protein